MDSTEEAAEKEAIQQQLRDLRDAVEANTRTQAKRMRWQWVALGFMFFLLVVVTAIGAAGYIDDRNDDLREEQAAELERARDCIKAQNTRIDAEDRLVDLAEDLGADPETINQIHDSYQAAPKPADCD